MYTCLEILIKYDEEYKEAQMQVVTKYKGDRIPEKADFTTDEVEDAFKFLTGRDILSEEEAPWL